MSVLTTSSFTGPSPTTSSKRHVDLARPVAHVRRPARGRERQDEHDTDQHDRDDRHTHLDRVRTQVRRTEDDRVAGDHAPVQEGHDREHPGQRLPETPLAGAFPLPRHVDPVSPQHGVLADCADVHDHCVAFAPGPSHRDATEVPPPDRPTSHPSVNAERSGGFTGEERGFWVRRRRVRRKSPIGSPCGPAPVPSVDERELRAAQAAVGVLLLGAFVFRMPELVSSSRSWSAPGRCSAPRVNLFHAAYRAVVGPRLEPAEDTVPLSDVRALDASRRRPAGRRERRVRRRDRPDRVVLRPGRGRGSRPSRRRRASTPRRGSLEQLRGPTWQRASARGPHGRGRHRAEEHDPAERRGGGRAVGRAGGEHGERRGARRCARPRPARRARSDAPPPKHGHGTRRACARTSTAGEHEQHRRGEHAGKRTAGRDEQTDGQPDLDRTGRRSLRSARDARRTALPSVRSRAIDCRASPPPRRGTRPRARCARRGERTRPRTA